MIDPAAERKRRANRMAYAGAAVLALIVGGIIWGNYSHPPARPLDPNLSPKDGPPAALLVVLVDTTDPINAVQQAQLKNQLQIDINGLPEFAQVQLYTVGPVDDALLRPLATVCNPGSGRGQNPLWSTYDLKKRRWQSRFVDPLDHELEQLMTAPSAETSPILESIQSIAASVFGRPDFDGVAKRLVIVSDMVQNTRGFSQYRELESFDQFRLASYYLTVRPHLDHVNVSILYLRRADVRRIQGRPHIEFWQDYFADAGATLAGIISVEG